MEIEKGFKKILDEILKKYDIGFASNVYVEEKGDTKILDIYLIDEVREMGIKLPLDRRQATLFYGILRDFLRKRILRMGNMYTKLLKSGELEEREKEAFERLKKCDICPHRCGVNRFERAGRCRSDYRIKVSSAFPHFGEEDCLVGTHGSGTIFLSNCPLFCVYCQNYEISQKGEGSYVSEERVADMMLSLQDMGCHNINLVTPTHFVPQLIRAIRIAAEGGLRIPIVYNTGGYERVETLKLLEGIIDIYMPDMKYGSNENALKYSGIPGYWDIVREAVKEMHRQVGDLVIRNGIAERGLLVRHLVLPNRIAGSEEVLKFLANLSKNTYINIMDQYIPCFKAYKYPELDRTITREEFDEVVSFARGLGLHRI